MSDEDSATPEKKPPTRSDYDQFRERAKGTNKLALLWIAALIIAWFTGLERVRRDVSNNANALQRNNLERQEVESQIKREHAKFEEALRNNREVDQIDYENAHLSEAETKLKQARQNDDKYAQGYYEKLIKTIKLRTTPLDKIANERDRMEAADLKETERYKREQYPEDKELIDKHDQNRQAREQQSQEKRTALIKEHQELKDQRKGVAFDILSLKFEVPPLYAPIIWSLFLIGLILYIMRSRSILLALCATVLRRPSSSAAAAAATSDAESQVGEAPWWLAPLPYLESPPQSGDTSADGSASPTLIQRLHDLLGWQRLHRIATLLTVVSLLCLILLQIRMVWLELELSEHLGSQRERAIISIVMTALLFVAFVAIWLWLRMKYIPEPDPRKQDHNRLTPLHMVLFFIVLAGFILLSVFVLTYPQRGVRYERIFKSWLPPLSLLTAAQLIVFCGYRLLRPKAAAVADPATTGARPFRRREFLFWALPVAFLGIVVVARASSKKAPRKRIRPNGHRRSYDRKRKRGKRKHVTVELSQGFYINPLSQIIHYVSEAHRISNTSEFKLGTGGLQPYADLLLPNQTPPVAAPDHREPDEADQETAKEAGGKARPSFVTGGAAQVIRILPTPGISPDSEGLPESSIPTLLSMNKFQPKEKNSPGKQASRWLTKPRVNLATASHAFEQAALSILQSPNLNHRAYGRACELLIYAINHDLYMKKKTGQPPSFRLYDLLAGITLRNNRISYFKEMLRLISDFDQQDIFQSRINKWQNPESSWYKRWHNYKHRIKWVQVNLK
jgi:hypothetical protein